MARWLWDVAQREQAEAVGTGEEHSLGTVFFEGGGATFKDAQGRDHVSVRRWTNGAGVLTDPYHRA